MRGDKRASIQWTVGKLLTIILLVVLLVLVIWGFSWGGMKPLMNSIAAKTNEVLILLNIKQDVPTGEVKCVDAGTWTIPGTSIVGDLEECAHSCKFFLSGPLGGYITATDFYSDSRGNLKWSSSPSGMLNDAGTINDTMAPKKMERERAAFLALQESFGLIYSESSYSSRSIPELMAKRQLRVYFKSGDRYYMYTKGDWYSYMRSSQISSPWVKVNPNNVLPYVSFDGYDVKFYGEKGDFGVWTPGTFNSKEEKLDFVNSETTKFLKDRESQERGAGEFSDKIETLRSNSDAAVSGLAYLDFGGGRVEAKFDYLTGWPVFYFDVPGENVKYGLRYGVSDSVNQLCLAVSTDGGFDWPESTACKVLMLSDEKFADRVAANKIFKKLYECAN